jgi:hypothetical protein
MGQNVWLTAPDLDNFSTSILGIQPNFDGTVTITIDIIQNFNTPFDITGYTTFFCYLPGTTNSQQLIYIPSALPSNNSENDYSGIIGVNDLDNLLATGGIDLLLDSNLDLIVTNSGDCLYSFGMANILQQIKLIFATRKR